MIYNIHVDECYDPDIFRELSTANKSPIRAPTAHVVEVVVVEEGKAVRMANECCSPVFSHIAVPYLPKQTITI